jgi:cytochrome c biogenesis protein CcmG, thiol:disulfide interchange protein DsbE
MAMRALLFLCGMLALSACRSAETGKMAPPLTATQIDGQAFALGKEVTIIHFWATWCEPCRKEMPALESYYQQHRAQGLRVLAISMDDPGDDASVRQLMRQFSFAAAFARDTDYTGYGRVWRMPMTFVVDRHGLLRKDGRVGDPGIDLATLEANVTPLLPE